MIDATRELKVRAEILHKQIQDGDAAARLRLRALPEHRRSSAEGLEAIAPEIQRRHCLNVVAAELGFANWTHAKSVLTGEEPVTNFGDLLCPPKCAQHLNHWCRTHEEAVELRNQTGGYLLAFRHQFLVVDRHYIRTLGLDPDDPDWKALGHDWARPRDVAARTRLYHKLIEHLPRATAPRP
jgi:hypothetical protein